MRKIRNVPFLTKLFEKEAEQVPFVPMHASEAVTGESVETSSRGAPQRELTRDDLVVHLLSTGTSALDNSFYVDILKGEIHEGDEVRIVRRDGVCEYSTVDQIMSADIGQGARAFVSFAGINCCDSVYTDAQVVYSGSDIEPTYRAIIAVDICPDAAIEFSEDVDFSFYLGQPESWDNDMTLLYTDGVTMIIEVELHDCGLIMFEHESVAIRWSGSTIAEGYISTVYLPE